VCPERGKHGSKHREIRKDRETWRDSGTQTDKGRKNHTKEIDGLNG